MPAADSKAAPAKDDKAAAKDDKSKPADKPPAKTPKTKTPSDGKPKVTVYKSLEEAVAAGVVAVPNAWQPVGRRLLRARQ